MKLCLHHKQVLTEMKLRLRYKHVLAGMKLCLHYKHVLTGMKLCLHYKLVLTRSSCVYTINLYWQGEVCALQTCNAGFDLTARDSYFTILVAVFGYHILAENTFFTNRAKRAQDYVLEICK